MLTFKTIRIMKIRSGMITGLLILLLSGHTGAQTEEAGLMKGIAYRQLEGVGERYRDDL